MKPKLSAGDWAALQKYPMTATKVRKYSIMRLAEMREVGIQFVEILGDKSKEGTCRTSLDLHGGKIEIGMAVPLPLPGCDKKYCKCIWLARQ